MRKFLIYFVRQIGELWSKSKAASKCFQIIQAFKSVLGSLKTQNSKGVTNLVSSLTQGQ